MKAQSIITGSGLVAVIAAVMTLAALSRARAADDVSPWETVPSDMQLPTNAVVCPAPEPPPLPGIGEPPPTIEPSVSFIGLDDDNSVIPPDTMGAVGPNHVVTMLNTQVRMSDRTGTNIYSTVSLSNFWGSVGGLRFPFDPRIVYDPYNQRWVAAAVADPPPYADTSSLLIGVSQTGNPTGAWHRAKIDVDGNNQLWADYPSLGFNQNWAVIQVNMYTLANAFSHARFYVFNLTNLYAGGTTYSSLSLTNYGGTVVPAVTYDTNQGTLYFLQTWNSAATNTAGQTNGYLRLYTLTGGPTSPTFNITTNFPQNDPWAFWPGNVDFAPQSNTTVLIRNNDSRVQNVVYRNGTLWCVQTVFLPVINPSRSAVQWWQIRTNGTVQQTGRIEDSSGVSFYAFPTIGVNRFNDAVIGFSSFATTQYASASYVFRAFTDAPDTRRPVTLLAAGEGRYYKTKGSGRNRWGDYSATMPDPLNDADFWTIQQYAATPTGTGTNDGDGRWAVRWGSVSVPVPGNDHFTNAYTISGGEGSTNGTSVRATREPNEPNHAGNTSTVSVWYQWTAPTNGNVTMDTVGSSFDTLLAVYTGTAVASLTLVTNDNNSGDGTASRITFSAASDTTYRIAVDGTNGVQGSLVLNWQQPTQPVFVLQPQNQSVIASNNVTFTSAAIGVPTPDYQWRKNGSNISGATLSSYTISNVQTNDAANYTVVATNTSGSVTSQVAILTVYHSASATLSSCVYSSNQFWFQVTGVTNLDYVVQANTNLNYSNWLSLATNPAPFNFTNQVSTNTPEKYFRVIYQP